jgi:hypothetical protein
MQKDDRQLEKDEDDDKDVTPKKQKTKLKLKPLSKVNQDYLARIKAGDIPSSFEELEERLKREEAEVERRRVEEEYDRQEAEYDRKDKEYQIIPTAKKYKPPIPTYTDRVEYLPEGRLRFRVAPPGYTPGDLNSPIHSQPEFLEFEEEEDESTQPELYEGDLRSQPEPEPELENIPEPDKRKRSRFETETETEDTQIPKHHGGSAPIVGDAAELPLSVLRSQLLTSSIPVVSEDIPKKPKKTKQPLIKLGAIPEAKAKSKKPKLKESDLEEIRAHLHHPVTTPFPYPFTTKKFDTQNRRIDAPIKRRLPTKSSNLSTFVKYQRPYFSPKFNSWETDFFSENIKDKNNAENSVSRHYMIFININTKLVQVYTLPLNVHYNTDFAIECVADMLKKFKIDNLRSDFDIVFKRTFQDYLELNNIKYHPSNSKYTNENRVVDRAIKTIKDGCGLDKIVLLYYPEIVLQVVDYYNNTPHAAYKNKFTPQQVQNDYELEAWYIRTQQLKLFDALLQQQSLRKFKPGDIVLVHRPLGKTPESFRKRRKNFDELATFIRYVEGNVEVKLFKLNERDEIVEEGEEQPEEEYTEYVDKNGNIRKRKKRKKKDKSIIILPIYYIKFICNAETFKARGVPKEYESFT